MPKVYKKITQEASNRFSYTAPAPKRSWGEVLSVLRPDRFILAVIGLALRIAFFPPRLVFYILGRFFEWASCPRIGKFFLFFAGGLGSLILFEP